MTKLDKHLESVAFHDGYEEGYDHGLEAASQLPEYWVVHKRDGGELRIGDLVHYKSWNNPYKSLPVIALGDGVVYLQWADGDVTGYDPNDLTKI